MRRLIIIIVITFAFATLASAQRSRFNFESRIGVADVNSRKELCLIILNANLSEGSRITLVAADKPQSLAQAIVQKRLAQSCSHNPDTPREATFYLLKLTKEDSRFLDERGIMPPSIAIIAAPRPVKMMGRVASVDLNGDGQREYFRQCTSTEGLHLTVWSGVPLKSKRKWHRYYYLHSTAVQSCKKKDYQ